MMMGARPSVRAQRNLVANEIDAVRSAEVVASWRMIPTRYGEPRMLVGLKDGKKIQKKSDGQGCEKTLTWSLPGYCDSCRVACTNRKTEAMGLIWWAPG